MSDREPNRLVTIKKNPNYAKGVSRKYKRRPANLSQINIKTVVNLEASYQEVRANQADYTYDIPPTAPAELGKEFGTTKGRFRVTGSNCVSYVAMNSGGTGSGAALFNNNPSLRRAVNYVINRKAMVDLSGAYAGKPTDQYLPGGFPGFRELGAKGYPNTSNVSRARQLANGPYQERKLEVLLRSRSSWSSAHGARAELPLADRCQHRSAGLPRVRDLRRSRQAQLAARVHDRWLVSGLLRPV